MRRKIQKPSALSCLVPAMLECYTVENPTVHTTKELSKNTNTHSSLPKTHLVAPFLRLLSSPALFLFFLCVTLSLPIC